MSLALSAVTGLMELNPGCTIREPVTTTSCKAGAGAVVVVVSGGGELLDAGGAAWSAAAATPAAGSASEASAALARAKRMAFLIDAFLDMKGSQDMFV
jgi:hypothetical protein